MDIADVKIGQELVYLTVFNKLDYGPRIRVTQIDGPRVVGIVLHPMSGPWPTDSPFLGLAMDFRLPEDVPGELGVAWVGQDTLVGKEDRP